MQKRRPSPIEIEKGAAMTIREIIFESIEKYSELKSFSFPTKDGVVNKTYRALGEDLRR